MFVREKPARPTTRPTYGLFLFLVNVYETSQSANQKAAASIAPPMLFLLTHRDSSHTVVTLLANLRVHVSMWGGK